MCDMNNGVCFCMGSGGVGEEGVKGYMIHMENR